MHNMFTLDAIIFNSNPMVNVLLSADMRCLDCNPATLELMGFTCKEEALEKFAERLNECKPATQSDGTASVSSLERIQHALRFGKDKYITEFIIDGKIRTFEITARRVPYKARFAVCFYLNEVSDIVTAKNELEAQSHMLRSVNDMSRLLMDANNSEFFGALENALMHVSKCIGAVRAAIWTNSHVTDEDGNDRVLATRIVAWRYREHEKKHAIAKIGRSFYLDEGLPEFADENKDYGIVTLNIAELAPVFRDLLDKDFPTMASVPISVRGKLWGFMLFTGMDDEITESDMDILQASGSMMASAITKHEYALRLIEEKEKAERSTRAKSDFLSRMSHEIRTPLNAVIGMAAVARKTSDMDKIQRCLDKVDASSRQLLGLINDILDMSKIDADKLIISVAEFDFEQMINNVNIVARVKMEEKRQELLIDVNKRFPDYMVSDELRLSQVLLNLLSNANKFTPESGRVTLIVRELTRDGEDILRCEVRDTGIGIKPDKLDAVFNSFEQADEGITRSYGGTGLGLSICKKIVGLMDGEIWVESEVGIGSCFIFEIPVRWGDKLPNAEVPGEELDAELIDWSGKHILLVEDIEINREIVMEILSDTNAAIDVAEDGQQAVDKVRANPGKYDVIIMDIQMPVKDGITATKEIRTIPEAKAVPIIAMTANAFKEDAQMCLDAGMNDHVAKPLDFAEVLSKLQKHMS